MIIIMVNMKPVQLLRLSTIQYTSPRAGQPFKVMPRVRRAEADAEIIDIISLSATPGDRIRGPVKVTDRYQAAVTVLRPGQGR